MGLPAPTSGSLCRGRLAGAELQLECSDRGFPVPALAEQVLAENAAVAKTEMANPNKNRQALECVFMHPD
jgi:hypothetical protein